MSSIKKTNPATARHNSNLRSAKPAPKPQAAIVPWYFWVVLVVLIGGGVVVFGSLLGNGSTSKSNSAATIGTTADARKLLTNGFGEGDVNAPVKVVEYADFQCPACKVFQEQVYPQLKKDYIDTGKIYFYYKPFPLTTIHNKAMSSAALAVCTADAGSSKFFTVHDLLYQNQDTWVNGNEQTIWPQYVTQAGADVSTVLNCVSKGTHNALMNANIAETQAIGVNSTPSFFVNKQLLVGPTYAQFQQAIAAANNN